MILGLSLTPFGHAPDAWQTGPGDAALGFAALSEQAAAAEAAGIDFLLLADEFAAGPRGTLSPTATPIEPTLLAAALAVRAPAIGFVAAAATARHAPYNLARRFASLDLVSHGRAGWLAVTNPSDEMRDAAYFSVVRGLWESFEPDAFLHDKAAGRFFAPDKMHVLDHNSAYFSVRGPLNVNPSPQGRPVLAVAVDHPGHVAHAASADLALIAAATIDALQAIVASLRALQVAPAAGCAKRVALVAPFVDGSFGDGPAALACPGDVDRVAAVLHGLVETAGVDGFVFMPATLADARQLLGDLLPKLGEKAEAGPVTTLRARLGLESPVRQAREAGHGC